MLSNNCPIKFLKEFGTSEEGISEGVTDVNQEHKKYKPIPDVGLYARSFTKPQSITAIKLNKRI